jgi:plastocyanin
MPRPQPNLKIAALIAACTFIGFASQASADQQIRFQDHHFTPTTLAVAAGQPIILTVVNASNETIEFESFKLNREKAVEPGQTITVKLPALSPGSYDFYDDFHQDVPQGNIVAR